MKVPEIKCAKCEPTYHIKLKHSNKLYLTVVKVEKVRFIVCYGKEY